jgi:hypothetical protein
LREKNALHGLVETLPIVFSVLSARGLARENTGGRRAGIVLNNGT